jgi:tRNA/rRNA methyltransferase
MNIPTREQHASMNLGQAVAVCLYELARGKAAHESTQQEARATAGELDRITRALLDALRASGYMHVGTEASTQDKVRRLVRRLNFQARDSEIWLGMLKQILWKLNSLEKSERAQP